MNKNRGFLLLFALFSAILASVSSVADDLAGLMSVDAGTNGVVEFEMPFAPMEPIGPQGYVSGIFSGDGGEYSDRLFKYDSVSGLLTNAVWGGYSWFDPATGLHSFMSAAPGDILYFFRTDDEPFRRRRRRPRLAFRRVLSARCIHCRGKLRVCPIFRR